MTKEQQDLAWAVLPKEFKEEVKKLYTNALNASNTPHDPDDRKWGNYRITLLEKLFGLHNLTSYAEGEAKPVGPRFKRCEKVITPSGEVCIIEDTHFENGSWLYLVGDPTQWIAESDLEPYTEPEKESRNLSQGTANCDNHFNSILKDSFSKERRLNIATLAMQGILSNPKLIEMGIYLGSDADRIARFALAHADALMAEADKLKEK